MRYGHRVMWLITQFKRSKCKEQKYYLEFFLGDMLDGCLLSVFRFSSFVEELFAIYCERNKII